MKYLFAALPLALFCFTPAQACELSASTSGGGLQKIYDPFAPQNTVADLRVVVMNSGEEACTGRFFVAPTDGQTELSAGGGQRLSYRIEGGAGGALPGEYGPFSANVPAGGSQTLTIQFTILPQQVVPVGFYTSPLTLRGEDQAQEVIPVGGSAPILTMAVPARSEMSISGAPSPSLSSVGMAPATINFPDAKMGQTGEVFVNVWANSSVQVRLLSENGGVLKHLQDSSLPPITYSARFNGVPIGLATSYTVQQTPPMNTVGASYPLEITLGDTSRNFAGRYRDRITVQVQSN
jgi:hypothetical protein